MHIPARRSLIEIAPDATRPSTLPDHVYAVLKQFKPSVIAAGDKIKLENTFDNSFAKKAAAKYK